MLQNLFQDHVGYMELTSRLRRSTCSAASANIAFRFNNRIDMNDSERFDAIVRQIVGKRLTYKELIGKTDPVNDASK